MRKAEGIRYLTQCADRNGTHWHGGLRYLQEDCPTCGGTNEAGHLKVPCSRYGRTGTECAPIAWRFAYLYAKSIGDPVDLDLLDYAMSLVVNDSDEVSYLIRNYGYRHYR